MPQDPPSHPGRPQLPLGDIVQVGVVILLHLVLVAWNHGAFPGGQDLLQRGGLVAGHMGAEPWRLLSSLFLHVDPEHVLWNGLSMMIFAVPLLEYLGSWRTASVYLLAGVGGGIVAGLLAPVSTTIVGSSGAVAGLFGAWVVLRYRSARYAAISWRLRVRTLGVAFLVLPSLVNPLTSSGQPVSVSAHLGGMMTGMLIGGVISSRLIPREPWPEEDEDEEDLEDERFEASGAGRYEGH